MPEEITTSTSTEADNSDLDAQIAAAFDEEPATTEDEKTEDGDQVSDQVSDQVTEDKSDNTIEVPEKFKGKDGNIDVNNLLKSYKELESFSSQKEAKWQEERAELQKAKDELDRQAQAREQQAQAQGFESALDMEQQYALINLEANEYAKYLHITEDPEAVRDLLINYINNPTKEALEEIELEFSPDVIKRVAIAKERQKMAYQNERQQSLETQAMTDIENVISTSVDSNNDLFKYKPFEDLFVNSLQRFKNNFTQEDANELMAKTLELKELWRQEFAKEHGIKTENNKATDKIASISSQNSAPATPDLNNMSQAELEKYIRKLI